MYYIDKIKQHLYNWKYFTKEHFVGIVFFISLLLFFILTIFNLNIVNIYNNDNTFIEQIIFIAGITLENWISWFTIIGFVCGLIWALYQYNKSTKRKQQEKASEIAQEFADNLIEKLGLISDTLMPNDRIKQMISKIINSNMLSQFTTIEIIKILDNNNCFEEFHDIKYSEEIQNKYNELLKKRYNEIERNKFESYFPLLIENTLNHLEAICISISSQAAGSQFIYNSLHQSFLYNVELLAIDISDSNNNNVDKYYTNIIQVYNMWNKQRKRDIKLFNKTQDKITKLTNKAEKEIDKLLNKRNETV